MLTTPTEEQRRAFEQQGYVVLRETIDDELLESAVGAIERLLDRGLAGEFGGDIRWIGCPRVDDD